MKSNHVPSPSLDLFISLALCLVFFVSSCSMNQPETGCIKGDCQNGKGTMLWDDGTVYAGEWKAGKMHGNGVMRYSNGTKYTGQWSSGMMHGKGEVTYVDGTRQLGVWEANQFVRGGVRPTKNKADSSKTVQSEQKTDPQVNPTISSSPSDRPTVSVNQPVSAAPSGLLSPGENNVNRHRPFDITNPYVELITPTPIGRVIETDEDQLVIQGKAHDESGIYKITLNGKRAGQLVEGIFKIVVRLHPGENRFDLMVVDKAFNATEIPIVVNRVVSSAP